jgi:hypothetical protein
MNEYIKITYPEKIYTEKNLLHSELEVILTLKHLEKYRKLRTEELSQKINLKNKMNELNNKILELEKSLPRIKIEKDKEEIILLKKQTIEKDDLEEEMEQIKERIRKLQSN